MDDDRPELQKAAPPSYDAATSAESGAPPTYEQLFGMGKMKKDVMEAKQNSSKGMFAVKLCDILCGSVACMIGLIFLAALPVTMIVIGSIYLDRCDGDRRIPIWLIVFGCFSLLSTLINVSKRVCKLVRRKMSGRDEDSDEVDYGRKTGSCLESMISVFLFIWIIIGSVWVFGFFNEYRNCTDSAADGCCHPVVYLFSFVTLIVIYVFSFLSLCCCCCCFVCLAFLVGAGASSEQN